MDRGAWRARVQVVAQSRTRLRQLNKHTGWPEGFPGGSSGEEPAANAGDRRDSGLTPGRGRSPGGGHGNPLQYSCLENPMDRGDWRATVHGGHIELNMTEAT